ncbi:hypothetical protein ACM01_03920 [Streptomyces viridochromogenes]|uniref:Uncharacterized protein n=1 Tax=Streptomyces viridochromogenes TaxID=1938 RepID=A0A0J7ZM05_STRVR|nr:hypothetical protein [Streptomyces viridochromogenes]KMS76969.1 hypothetical protein ACM01_03920 [Streptomyces viridochromogenes]
MRHVRRAAAAVTAQRTLTTGLVADSINDPLPVAFDGCRAVALHGNRLLVWPPHADKPVSSRRLAAPQNSVHIREAPRIAVSADRTEATITLRTEGQTDRPHDVHWLVSWRATPSGCPDGL